MGHLTTDLCMAWPTTTVLPAPPSIAAFFPQHPWGPGLAKVTCGYSWLGPLLFHLPPPCSPPRQHPLLPMLDLLRASWVLLSLAGAVALGTLQAHQCTLTPGQSFQIWGADDNG